MAADSIDEEAKALEERRLHRRTLFRTLQVQGESKKLHFTGYVRNLSLGGLFIQTTSPKPVGAKLRLQLPLERGLAPIEVTAEVLWIQAFDVRSKTPPGMGARFTDLDAGSARRIETFLAQNETDSGRQDAARPGPGRAAGEPSA